MTPDYLNPPDVLHGLSRDLWLRLVPKLHRKGRFSPIYLTAAACFCIAYADYLQAREVIKREGATYRAGEQILPFPEVEIAETARQQARKWAGDFLLIEQERVLFSPLDAEGDDAELKRIFL